MSSINMICEHRDGASRQQIVNMSGLKMQIVDEHVKNLKTDGLIKLLVPGFYAPVDQEYTPGNFPNPRRNVTPPGA